MRPPASEDASPLPKVVDADGEERHERDCRSEHPNQHDSPCQSDVGEQEEGDDGRTARPAEMHRKRTVHGPVGQTNEHHAEKREKVERIKGDKRLKQRHETTLRGRLNIIFETPRMKGNFGMAIMTLKRSLHPAFPLIKRMNSSPDKDCAMRPNKIGPC